MAESASREVTILIAEDDDGHAELVKDNLHESGVRNRILRFRNGREVLDFLLCRNPEPASNREAGRSYLLLLDIRMPKVDGIEVLRQVKAEPDLKNMPVIMLTTTDDPGEIRACYDLGCNCYVTKPVDYVKFTEVLSRLGMFLLVVQVPNLTTAVAP